MQKDIIGRRIAGSLHKLVSRDSSEVAEGPRATTATASKSSTVAWDVAVTFIGGTAPLMLAGSKNCTTCCDAKKDEHTLDFAATVDGGASWVNATQIEISGDKVTFQVRCDSSLLCNSPTKIRYTATAIFPQCTLYNREGLPAVPFEMGVSSSH